MSKKIVYLLPADITGDQVSDIRYLLTRMGKESNFTVVADECTLTLTTSLYIEFKDRLSATQLMDIGWIIGTICPVKPEIMADALNKILIPT